MAFETSAASLNSAVDRKRAWRRSVAVWLARCPSARSDARVLRGERCCGERGTLALPGGLSAGTSASRDWRRSEPTRSVAARREGIWLGMVVTVAAMRVASRSRRDVTARRESAISSGPLRQTRHRARPRQSTRSRTPKPCEARLLVEYRSPTGSPIQCSSAGAADVPQCPSVV